MRRRAFSLIELMVAVSILAIGIVAIARSFLSASNALSNGDNRILALNLLEGKMAEIEEEALKDSDNLTPTQQDIVISSKTFNYRADLDKIKAGEGEEGSLNKVSLNAGWKEGSMPYDEILATYINIEKKE